MKKHELLKHAYDNYQKGTEFKSATTGLTGISSGSFRLDGTGGVADCKSGMQIFSKIVGKWAEIVKPKIAVKVENEKEFKALMKYYDSLGWESWNDHDIERSHNAGEAIDFHDNYRSAIIEIQEMDRYQIIPFSEFAEKHNIKLPLITSEDGVDLYEDSDIHIVWKDGSGWEFDNSHKGFKSDDGGWYVNPEIVQPERKIFSTKQAALDWIEAQKPKEKEIWLFDKGNKAVISKDRIQLLKNGSIKMVLKPSDFEDILNELKSL